MKKIAILLVAALAVQSCTSNQLYGTTTGMFAGGMMGGAIGGLMGGHRGHDLGTMVGVIAGGALGAAATSSAERRYDEYVDNYNASSRNRSYSRSRRIEDNNDGYYPNDNSSANSSSSVTTRTYPIATPDVSKCPLKLRNLRFVDAGGNQTVNREEECKIIFELSNPTTEAIYDVIPAVDEISGNSHIYLSPSTRIEVIKAGDVIRYTCSLRSDKKINAGTLKFRICVSYADNDFITLREFTLPTAK